MSEAYARSTDPDTSHEAAQDMAGQRANRLEAALLKSLGLHPEGMTTHELVSATGLPWNTASPRLAPMRRKGLVQDSGQRRLGPAGKKCIVWKAV